MTDVSALVGASLGGEIVNLAHLVLLTQPMREDNRLRHFSAASSSSSSASASDAAAAVTLTQQIDSLINYIDGTFAASRPSVQQRYYGNDAARMLRAPLLLPLADEAGDFARCFVEALRILSPGTRYNSVEAARRYHCCSSRIATSGCRRCSSTRRAACLSAHRRISRSTQRSI